MPSNPNDRTVLFGNIPFSTTHQQLSAIFSSCGIVTGLKINTAANGNSLGNGMVEYDTVFGASAAVKQLGNFKVEGRNMTVKAKSNSNNNGSANKSNNTGGKKQVASNSTAKKGGSARVAFFNAPVDMKKNTVRDYFSAAGSIQSFEVVSNKNGSFSGRGFVTYKTAEAAQICVTNLNDTQLGKSLVTCKIDQGGSQVGAQNCKVFFTGLPREMPARAISDLLNKHSATVSVDLIKSKGQFSGSGTATFTTAQGAKHVISVLNGKLVGGREIVVKMDTGAKKKKTTPPLNKKQGKAKNVPQQKQSKKVKKQTKQKGGVNKKNNDNQKKKQKNGNKKK